MLELLFWLDACFAKRFIADVRYELVIRSLVMIWFTMYLYHCCCILVCRWLFGISLLILMRMGQLGGESAIDNLQLPNLLRRRDALLLMVGYRTLK